MTDLQHGDREAERIVLSHYLVRREADVRDSTVGPESFADTRHRSWWTAAMAADTEWRPIDFGITPDDMALLGAMRPKASDVVRAESRMVKRWQLRHLAERCGALLESIRSGELSNSDEALRDARVIVGEVEAGGTVELRTHRQVGIELFRDWADAVHQGEKRLLPMPSPSLNQHLGGYQAGKLYMVCAVTSGHKTTWARQSCWHLAKHGHHPLFWPMEDSAEEMASRTFAQEIRQVDTSTFTRYEKPKGITEGDFEDLIRQLSQHLESEGASRLVYLDEATPRLSRVIALLSTAVAKGCTFVALDFAQLIQPDDPRTPEVQHWFQMSNALQAAAKRLNVPILATVQPTQAATREQLRSKRPLTKADIRGGSSIAQSAYGVLIFNRVFFDSDAGEGPSINPRLIDVDVDKWKNAGVRRIRLSVDPASDTITDPRS